MSAWVALMVSGTALADSDADILERIRPIGKVNVAQPAAAPAVPAPAAAAPAPAPAEAAPAAAEEAAPAEAAPPAEAAAPEAPAETAAAAPAGGGDAAGKKVYDGACFVCHMAGISGAPKLGDKAAWEARIAKGMDALMQSAINGIPSTAMPPRGTCAACSDDDLKVAVEYMVSQAQ
jgi:cytochrome c5